MGIRKILGVFAAVLLLALGSALAQDRASASGDYLALGDSVPFGYISQAGFQYFNSENFVGYPDWAGIGLGLNDENAACPGEATGSFLSNQQPDNGCRLYRQHAPLHVNYGSAATQFAYATNFLQQNGGNTGLVTIQLGSDDVLLLEEQCDNNPQCIAAGLPQVLQTAGTNMATILGGLRQTGYAGAIVVVNYYSTDYTNQNITQITSALNQAITAPASLFGAVVADVFSAFQAASQPAGGRTCVAGLLNAKHGNNALGCDIHPSQSGQKLIAQTIASSFQSSAAKNRK
jgi:lysophospholipase L1-like esterase